MDPFKVILSLLEKITDPRRAEGKLYALKYVLLFSILAIATGANSYRGIHTFIKVNLRPLKRTFKLKWKRAPAYTALRYILSGLSAEEIEAIFREYAANLNGGWAVAGARIVALDGKALKGSFDNFHDAKAKQILSAFAVDTALVLGHIEIDEKSNEIPAAQKLLRELNIADHIITLDAMHCQKKRSR